MLIVSDGRPVLDGYPKGCRLTGESRTRVGRATDHHWYRQMIEAIMLWRWCLMSRCRVS
jgi:hypothetical protein